MDHFDPTAEHLEYFGKVAENQQLFMVYLVYIIYCLFMFSN